MDIAAAASMAFSMIDLSLTTAKRLGLLGDPDWIKYTEAGLFVAGRAVPMLNDMVLNRAKYDAMGPAEIRALLAPATWDEIEAEAQRQLDAGG